MFDFLGLKDQITKITNKLGELRTELEEVRRERARVQIAPSAKEDVRRAALAWVDAKSTALVSGITGKITSNFGSTNAITGASTMPRAFGLVAQDGRLDESVTIRDFEAVICALHGDLVKRILANAIEGVEWDATALPQAQRELRLNELGQREAVLVVEIAELQKKAEDAGIDA